MSIAALGEAAPVSVLMPDSLHGEAAVNLILSEVRAVSEPEQWHRTALQLAMGRRTTLAALDGNQVVAVGALQSDHMTLTAEVVDVATAPNVRRQGFGSRIMEGLESEARQQGMVAIRLHATADSRAFYTELGYRLIASDQPASEPQSYPFMKML